MARQPRLDAPGALHHVMGRGIEGVKIFRSNTDREDFLSQKITDLKTLAGKIRKETGIEESDLRSGSKVRPIAKARKVFARIAVKEMGYSGAEVARFLGVTTSAVNRLAVSKELDEVKMYT